MRLFFKKSLKPNYSSFFFNILFYFYCSNNQRIPIQINAVFPTFETEGPRKHFVTFTKS